MLVVDPFLEALFLFVVVDGEPVLEQQDAVLGDHPFELRAGGVELLDLFVGGEAHHLLHAGTVVPAAIKDHDFTGAGEMLHIALEIPLTFLLIGRRTQGHNTATAWVQRFGESLDRTTFASGIAAFKQHNHAKACGLHPVLHLHQLGLQLRQFFLVNLLAQPFVIVGEALLKLHKNLLRIVNISFAVMLNGLENSIHVGVSGGRRLSVLLAHELW